jgi:hypothetical protein
MSCLSRRAYSASFSASLKARNLWMGVCLCFIRDLYYPLASSPPVPGRWHGVNDINTSVGIEKKNDPNGPISASVDSPFAIAGVARRPRLTTASISTTETPCRVAWSRFQSFQRKSFARTNRLYSIFRRATRRIHCLLKERNRRSPQPRVAIPNSAQG